MELRIRFGFFSDEIQEIPLGHDADEFAVHGQVGKIGNGNGEIVDGGADLQKLLMRDAQEIIEEAELIHEFERGWVNGVAAEIAEEVGVFFEDEDFDASTGEKKAEHYAGGAASCDAAGGCCGWRGEIGRHGASLGWRVCHVYGAGRNRVYNAGNLFASARLVLNDCAIWRHDGDSCSE
jgi:hypothetical protein